MQTKATAKFVHMSPKKVRLVADAVRGAQVEKALATLRFMNKKATTPITKIIESAVANAVHNFELQKSNLFVKELRVDDAPTIKRWMPRAFGRATPIRKRMSHISVVVAEIEDSGEKTAKKQAIDAPVKVGDMAASDEQPKDTKKKTTKQETKETADTSSTQKETKPEGAKKEDRPAGDGGRGNKGNKGFASKMFRRKSG